MGVLKLSYFKNLNKFDYFIILTIISLAYGEYEALGAFTPIRLIGALSICNLIKNWRILKRSPFVGWLRFLFFWWLCMTVSILWTPDMIKGVIYWYHFTCIIGCILFLFRSTLKAKSPLFSFSMGWMLFVVITLPIALWEIYTGSHLSSGSFNEGAVFGGEWRRFAAVTFANYNSYSLMLTYTLPFFVLLTWSKSEQRGRLFRLIVITTFVITSIILLINSSRAAFVCLFILVIIVLIFQYKDFSTFQRVFLLGITSLSVYLLIQNIENIEIFSQLFARLDGGNAFADSNRTKLIKIGLKIASDNYYMGGGIMSMVPLYSRYQADFNYAHNLIIELLVEHGALICGLFLGLFAKSLMKIYRIKEHRYRFLFYFILFSFPFMIVIDDSYFGRSGFWIYLATIISISEIPGLIKNQFQYNCGKDSICSSQE